MLAPSGEAAAAPRTDARPFLLLLALAVVAADRLSKLWISAHLETGQAITMIPHVFRITHVLNTGAAFSLFESVKNPETVRYALIGFSILAVCVVLGMIWKLGRSWSLTAVSLALILGGAVGNLYDRIRLHYVVDFLEVHIVHYHWPDFNVADSCIVIGACLLMLEALRPGHHAGN